MAARFKKLEVRSAWLASAHRRSGGAHAPPTEDLPESTRVSSPALLGLLYGPGLWTQGSQVLDGVPWTTFVLNVSKALSPSAAGAAGAAWRSAGLRGERDRSEQRPKTGAAASAPSDRERLWGGAASLRGVSNGACCCSAAATRLGSEGDGDRRMLAEGPGHEASFAGDGDFSPGLVGAGAGLFPEAGAHATRSGFSAVPGAEAGSWGFSMLPCFSWPTASLKSLATSYSSTASAKGPSTSSKSPVGVSGYAPTPS